MWLKILSAIKNFTLIPENCSNNNGSKTIDMERIAIDQSGCLGSFYDGCQDTILGKLDANIKSQSYNLIEPATCRLHKGRTAETQRLLEMIDIDDQLQLSITLKIAQPTGIASLVDYPHSIDRYTRFLYFYQRTLIESCHNDTKIIKKLHQFFVSETSATHIITEIVWGIHVIIVLQLSPDQEASIDRLLGAIRQSFINSESFEQMTSDDKALLRQITSTTVYSNTPDLTKLTKLDDICQRIARLRGNPNEHRRLKYGLRSIQFLCPEYTGNNIRYVQFDPVQIESVEDYLLQKSSELKKLKFCLDCELSDLLQRSLEEQLNDIRRDLSKIQKQYEQDIQQIHHFILIMRKGQIPDISIDERTSLDLPKEIQDRIDNIVHCIDELKAKGNLIKQLQRDGFEYRNVVKQGIEHGCDEGLIQKILSKNNPNQVIFCSHDLLKNRFHEDWKKLYAQMIEKQKENSALTLVYADFTYSTFYLGKMVILTSNEQTIVSCDSNLEASSNKTKRKAPPPPLLSNDDYINILLIGESGVGKSTFINAFANYLRFNTLQEAQSGEPIVVIPVSFLMTVNDDFGEHLVKFGDPDPNEDHSNSGQSVTQQCRSYAFEISPGRKLRIIDTPGFGDTRGEHQDDLNMEVIFSFVNHFTYLNGICLLFKPNAAQLNPFMYSCCTQLFQYFGENIRDHFIFCFTNARSTFFAPGDTRPLLKSFFDKFPVKNVPLERKNTFCFDSESFRYLVALRKAMTFNAEDRNEFEKSWTRSVVESKRFRDFLCKELRLYRKNAEWQSNQEAQFQIHLMIRPMLEAIRNILRNILLHEINASIKLTATFVDRRTVVCYKCQRTAGKFGQFWILPDHLHPLPNECNSNEQSPTEYRLDYEFLNDQIIEPINILNEQRKSLYETCTHFVHFLKVTWGGPDDPFLSGLVRMIDEENSICQSQNQSTLNQQLANELRTLLKEYQQLADKTQSSSENETLSNIYELIISVNDMPIVKEQMGAIKKYDQLLLKVNENDIDVQQSRL